MLDVVDGVVVASLGVMLDVIVDVGAMMMLAMIFVLSVADEAVFVMGVVLAFVGVVEFVLLGSVVGVFVDIGLLAVLIVSNRPCVGDRLGGCGKLCFFPYPRLGAFVFQSVSYDEPMWLRVRYLRNRALHAACRPLYMVFVGFVSLGDPLYDSCFDLLLFGSACSGDCYCFDVDVCLCLVGGFLVCFVRRVRLGNVVVCCVAWCVVYYYCV